MGIGNRLEFPPPGRILKKPHSRLSERALHHLAEVASSLFFRNP
jgi:hypothetical protein